jgi:hypothetical protein
LSRKGKNGDRDQENGNKYASQMLVTNKNPSAPPALTLHDHADARSSAPGQTHETLPRLNRLDSTPESFWDIGNYKYALKRYDNGAKLAQDLTDMISERAKLEEAYAKSLRQWSKKWYDYLQNESTEYETSKDAWYAYLDMGNRAADVHQDACKEIVNKPVMKIKDWQKKRYEKHIVNFKQTKEFENEFESAQKSWFELNEKLKKAKKDYYDAIRGARAAEEASRAALTNPKMNQEQRDKLEEKSKRAREEEERAQRKYKDVLIEMDIYKPRHMQKMTDVFAKTQNFEQERMLFFKQTFMECYALHRQAHTDARFNDLFENFHVVVDNINPKEDLDWWANTFGPGTAPNWPVYEEFHEKA